MKLAKTGHGPHSSTLVCICVVRLLFVLFYVLFVCKCVLPPGDNPIAVNIISSNVMKIRSVGGELVPCRRTGRRDEGKLSGHESVHRDTIV